MYAVVPDSPHMQHRGRFDEERVMHEAKLLKMEAEMKSVFQHKVAEKEARLKQSEEELYARHREMKEQLERQRKELEVKKRMLEGGNASAAMGGRPGTPETKKWTFIKK
jgi:septin 7